MARYAAAIRTSAGAVFWLPQPILSWSDEAPWRNVTAEPLAADGELLLGQTAGSRSIQIEGMLVGWAGNSTDGFTRVGAVSRASLRAQQAALEAALRGEFELYRYEDAHYQNCVCEGLRILPNRPDLTATYSLSVRALDPAEQTDKSVDALLSPYRMLMGGDNG